MKPKHIHLYLIYIYIMIATIFLVVAHVSNHAVTAFTESAPLSERTTIIIDAGHGGEDGGATSCTGVLECDINLQIALRLDDLLHLMGYNTKMIRKTDISIYKKGETIAAKKVSDLKERVRIVNETKNALLISIHQNTFSESKYHGAQVFYSADEQSKSLANLIQNRIIHTINIGSSRSSKKANGIYLMEQVNTTAVLIECGFLSNPEEEAKLRDQAYQNSFCCVIAASLSEYINT